MISIEVQVYLRRARDLLEGMNILLKEEMFLRRDDLIQFRYSPALLGIHGAISYCDALRVGLGSDSLPSDDHRSAIKDLKSLLAARRFEKQQGADRLDKLLGKKSSIAYVPDALDDDEVKRIVQHAERFAHWAETAGKELRIEGW